MKRLLLLIIPFAISCKRFEADQTVITDLYTFRGRFSPCAIFTDVWDTNAGKNIIVQQFELPCDATDSSRQADLKKAQSIAETLNKANQ